MPSYPTTVARAARACALLLGAAWLAPALAQSTVADPVLWQASYAQQRVSNLFLLPPGADTQALIGQSRAAEVISSSTLGVVLHTQQSQQKFDFTGSVVNNQYQNFSYLGYTGENYNAVWSWQLGQHWAGQLTSTRAQTQNSYTDYTGYQQRNTRTDVSNNLSADYALGASWHLTAAAFNTLETNEQPLLAGGNYNSVGVDSGVRYDPGSGDTLSYLLKTSTFSYFNQTVPSPAAVDPTNYETDQIFQLQLVTGAGTSTSLQLVPFNRTMPTYGQRNYSGVNSTLNYNYIYSGKTGFNASYRHDIETYATATTNYSDADILALTPSWQFSPKATLRLQWQQSRTDYAQVPSLAIGVDRIDTTQDTSVALTWSPNNNVTLTTSLENITNTSNNASLSYQNTLLTFNAQFIF